MAEFTAKQKAGARSRLSMAVLRGTITRPIVCDKCGKKPYRIQAHHHDYSKPFDVEWLCTDCHNKVHANDAPSVYTVRVPLLVSKDQYRRLIELANASKCSVGALLRSLINNAN